ncbi:uncharacterized protein PFL1_06088 [Pseudozyma flocculosa PF-1]|uniref:Related to SGT1 - subunit of SCF ubiquitin ligase complex n=2 Tax=Pseudozyma flocculosa TaxID=84751 RepID=A0A5C3F4S9_9BASI|nr:uncharacterized protein PFL1_06088 [Pseudozyma flocculosa PF-1]EPQ26440.1 hypothetical protein PFL1_06088 [Pseudozyma flocculosa PF-1]SPO38966.1 related to SGT1 - subunit of SCF ubiquitin ligase complex [Pseudozyma flocculosa]
MSKPRFDFYQTDTSVTVSIFIKGANEDDVQVNIGDSSLSVSVNLPATGAETALVIDPLFSRVNKEASSYKVYSTKIDVVLDKAAPGVQWRKLEADSSSVGAGTTPSYIAAAASSSAAPSASVPAATTTAAPTRPRSKWDTLKLDDDDDDEAKGGAGAGAEGEADINKFFQKLYADADEDTKRAMLKSYQESGGTTLSTDWSKVGQGRVETRPPEGMVAKKWEQ